MTGTSDELTYDQNKTLKSIKLFLSSANFSMIETAKEENDQWE